MFAFSNRGVQSGLGV